jgi:16S rRNA (guanine527-N7)-methyltransferase
VSTAPVALRQVLDKARDAGFLGPGPIETHLTHADGFAECAEAALGHLPQEFCDLGTGGGVPGLALAVRWSQAHGLLVDSNERRAAFLREAIEALDLGDRVRMLEQRAEIVGHPGQYREGFELVTARSFASPPITAEIAAGIVSVGGCLVVSEPPEPDAQRWPVAELGSLGFGPPELVLQSHAHFAVLHKVGPAPSRFPRAVGKPGKRPLW